MSFLIFFAGLFVGVIAGITILGMCLMSDSKGEDE